MTKAFVFPGQGSQAVGMGRELAEAFAPARLVFEEINDALDQNLSKLMFEGPDDELRLTENAQPALMAVSMAIVRVLAEEGGIVLDDKAAFVAGHSLGEYSALAAAGGGGAREGPTGVGAERGGGALPCMRRRAGADADGCGGMLRAACPPFPALLHLPRRDPLATWRAP